MKSWFGVWTQSKRAPLQACPDVEAVNEDDNEIEEIDPYNPFPDPIAIEIRDVFDLHTIAPRDVQRVIVAYLEEAHRAGFRTVRIIHGKGIGVQREIVRGILSRTEFVIDWSDAPPEAGGWGATIARLRLKDE